MSADLWFYDQRGIDLYVFSCVPPRHHLGPSSSTARQQKQHAWAEAMDGRLERLGDRAPQLGDHLLRQGEASAGPAGGGSVPPPRCLTFGGQVAPGYYEETEDAAAFALCLARDTCDARALALLRTQRVATSQFRALSAAVHPKGCRHAPQDAPKGRCLGAVTLLGRLRNAPERDLDLGGV